MTAPTGAQLIPFGVRPEPIGGIRCQCCALLLIDSGDEQPGGGPVIWKYCRFGVTCGKCGTRHLITSGDHGVRIEHYATPKGARLSDNQRAHDTSPRVDNGQAAGIH